MCSLYFWPSSSTFSASKNLPFLSSTSSMGNQQFTLPLWPTNLPPRSLHLPSSFSLVTFPAYISFLTQLFQHFLSFWLIRARVNTHTHTQIWTRTVTCTPISAGQSRVIQEWRAGWDLITENDVLVNLRKQAHMGDTTLWVSFIELL